MNKDYYEVRCKVFYHYENVPKGIQGLAAREFMERRHIAVDIFNNHIDEINDYCDRVGIPGTVDGTCDGEMNPEYVSVIRETLAAELKEANKHLPLVKYAIDDDGNIIGRIPLFRGSKIWITIKLLNERES